ncbi:MAG: hypothetical protein LBQ51_01525 [Desulfovibrio sp.]|jgi:hypothetical protein|nr:hypothetical protein [Desulfovibrio sp.]
MLNRQDIHSLLEKAFNETANGMQKGKFSLSLSILGADGIFDSMDAMSFLTRLDELLSDAAGTDIVLAGDDAFSSEATPFKSMGTLAEYIEAHYAQD